MVFTNQILIPRSKFKSNFYCTHCGEYKKQEDCINLRCPECKFKIRTKPRNPSFQTHKIGDRSKRRCEFCLQEFIPQRSDARFCRILCGARFRRGVKKDVLNRNCRECGKLIKNPRFKKYDSSLCARIGQARKILLSLQKNLRENESRS